MKVLCIGDPHYKKNNIVETKNMENRILSYAKKNKPDMIVVLGDILNDFENVTSPVLCRSILFLRKLRKISRLYVIIGNHDRINNQEYLTDIHGFTALKEWKNTYVVDKPIFHEYKGCKFLFVPYVPNGTLLETLEPIDNWKESHMIFCHQEFMGCKMGAFYSQNGDDWSLSYPLVVSGHIHQYQMPQENIIYTGTPIQHGYSDTQDKTISMFILGKSSHKESKVSTKHILKGVKCHHIRYLIKQKRKKCVVVKIADIEKKELENGIDYKIKIRGTSGELKEIMKHEKVISWKSKGYLVVKDVIYEKVEPVIISKRKELSYGEILFGKIKNDDNLVSCYEEIFGRLEK